MSIARLNKLCFLFCSPKTSNALNTSCIRRLNVNNTVAKGYSTFGITAQHFEGF